MFLQRGPNCWSFTLAHQSNPPGAMVIGTRWRKPSNGNPNGPRCIDDSDGGCDDLPQCKGGSPWTHEIDALEIKEGDAVTDSAEAYYLMQQRGITNLIVLGVHGNMCVLGRPFSIRQMVHRAENVVFMRD